MQQPDSGHANPAASPAQSAYGGPRIAERASPTPGEWQPMETAPKDGSRFLAWNRWDQGVGFYHWQSAPEGSTGWPVGWRSDFIDVYPEGSPKLTHWMPLPTPPAALNKASPSSQEKA